MKKRSKSKVGIPKVDPFLEGLAAKLLDRLVHLEKKMDTLIAQTSGKPGEEVKEPVRRERILYEAICADCHKVCEVPFKPSEDRAVYCKTCFAKRKSLPAGRQAAGTGRNFPVMTAVSLPPKPVGKLHLPVQAPSPTNNKPQKNKKKQTTKKSKKKK